MSDQKPSDTGVFRTPNASKYLQQLCKHFGHKAPVEISADTGRVELSIGVAEMLADAETLTVTVTGDDLPRLREVIDKHLARFAFREEFSAMDWS